MTKSGYINCALLFHYTVLSHTKYVLRCAVIGKAHISIENFDFKTI